MTDLLVALGGIGFNIFTLYLLKYQIPKFFPEHPEE